MSPSAEIPAASPEPAGPAAAVGVDLHDVELVRRADGLLAAFNRAGVLGAADVHVALTLGRLGHESQDAVLLAAALAVRAVRHGSVCVELAVARDTSTGEGVPAADVAALPWPDTTAWLASLEASPLVAVGQDGPADRPLRLVDGLLYLDRYWRQEQVIAHYVDTAARDPLPAPDADRLRSAVGRLFPATPPDRQRLATVVAAHSRMSVLAGGPGTGKTTTVAKLLALLQDQPGGPLRVALAAPTGRAAARLQQAALQATEELGLEDRQRLGPLEARTLHRLLGYKPGARNRFFHDRTNRLPFDVVVVDEASMVSLTMMSRLVDALRPDTRLILVGDPDQLASVEVGAVLGDLASRPVRRDAAYAGQLETLMAGDLADLDAPEHEAATTRGVVRLRHVYRFPEEIQQLAAAIRGGQPDRLFEVLEAGHDSLELVDTDLGVLGSHGQSQSGAPGQPADPLATLRADVLRFGRELVDAARAGDAKAALEGLDRHRLMCAHREGPHGVARWGRLVEEWLGDAIPGYARDGLWYVGRPLLVTSNDYRLRLFNGDTGVVVDIGGHPRAAFHRDGELVLLPTSRLSDVETVHALSVHRSQGSQFDHVTVVVPPAESPLLTRELLYTAVTRARKHVRILGTRTALSAAVQRPIVRASGLGRRAP